MGEEQHSGTGSGAKPGATPVSTQQKQLISQERWEIVQQLEGWLEGPLIVLGLVWLALFVVEVVWGLSPLLQTLSMAIWAIFIVDFVLRFLLAPNKWIYLRRNWLTLIALFVPAVRVLRVARLVQLLRLTQATRSLQLLRIVSSVNRGMKALGKTMRRRGLAYVIALTLMILFVGAAGLLAFESNAPGQSGIHTYGAALWWTAMALTTVGTGYSPQSVEGRVLALGLIVYGLAVFGYLTASLATFFLDRDAISPEGEMAGQSSIEALRREIKALREELHGEGGANP